MKRTMMRKRAEAIINSPDAYDADTRRALQLSLERNDAADIREMVRRAEAGDTLCDLTDPLLHAPAAESVEGFRASVQPFFASFLQDKDVSVREFAESTLDLITDAYASGGIRHAKQVLDELRKMLELPQKQRKGKVH
jgi:hypothetical protein